MGEQKLGNKVGLLVGCGREIFAVGIAVINRSVVGSGLEDFLVGLRFAVGVGVVGAVLEGEKGLFLNLE